MKIASGWHLYENLGGKLVFLGGKILRMYSVKYSVFCGEKIVEGAFIRGGVYYKQYGKQDSSVCMSILTNFASSRHCYELCIHGFQV